MKEVVLPKLAPQVYEIPDDLLESTRQRILILEDDAAFAAGLKTTLETASYRVTVVPTGAEGVQQILASDFDAIVCDMVMPNFPGDMFYRAVQQSRPHLCRRFIFITGHQGNPGVVEFIKQTGCVGLWKPFDMGQLFDALGSVFAAAR